MGHPTMQENDTAKLTPTPLKNESVPHETHPLQYLSGYFI